MTDEARVLAALAPQGSRGLTRSEFLGGEFLGDVLAKATFVPSFTGALSTLHEAGRIARRAGLRNREKIYVLPHFAEEQ